MTTLITGITGTLGTIVSEKLFYQDKLIYGVSRDEQKQRLIKKPSIRPILCDIRDKDYLEFVILRHNVRTIYHFAALKCVDTMELNPDECVKTNILGTSNICSIASRHGLKVIFTSTDKAVNPINVYGQSKAIAERMVLNVNGVVCRYGNVIGSRGSVIPFFHKLMKDGKVIPITSESMTRFWISLDKAAEFVTQCAKKPSGVYVPEIGAAPLMAIVEAISRVCDLEYTTNEIGLRPGEKIHEELNPGFSSEVRTLSDSELDELVKEAISK